MNISIKYKNHASHDSYKKLTMQDGMDLRGILCKEGLLEFIKQSRVGKWFLNLENN